MIHSLLTPHGKPDICRRGEHKALERKEARGTSWQAAEEDSLVFYFRYRYHYLLLTCFFFSASIIARVVFSTCSLFWFEILIRLLWNEKNKYFVQTFLPRAGAWSARFTAMALRRAMMGGLRNVSPTFPPSAARKKCRFRLQKKPRNVRWWTSNDSFIRVGFAVWFVYHIFSVNCCKQWK